MTVTRRGVAALCALLAAGSRGAARPSSQGPLLAPPGFHHLHLNTTDPQQAIAFYLKYLPATSPASFAGQPALRTGHVLVLFNRVDAVREDRPQSAFWHFGWHVSSAKAYWERYTRDGAPVMPLYTDERSSVTFSNDWWPATLTRAEIPRAQARGVKSQNGGYGYLKGPDGARIEFQGDMPDERFNHVHMYQDDVYCAERWYSTRLNAPLSQSARRSNTRPPADADCKVATGDPSWLSLVPEGTKRTPAGGVVFDDVEVNWYQRQGPAALASPRGQVMDHIGLKVRDLDAW